MTNAPFDRSTGGDALAVAAILTGTPGDDELEAAGDGDILRGYGGRDVLTSAFNATELYGDADDDRLFTGLTVAEEVSALQDGGSGNDRLTVEVRAQLSNPKLDLTLRGGAGDDALSVSVLLTAETFYYPSVVNALSGGDGADTLRAEIAMTGPIYDGGSIRVENLLSGGLGADRLQVVGGLDNILDGGQGADVMIGGTGDDTYYVDDAGDVTFESGVASGGADVVYSLVDHRLGQGIERLVLLSLATTGIGNGRDNEITGNRMANTLHGYGRDDLLSGLGGNDLLYGGDGNDHVIGGDGDDQVKGGAGDDVLEGGAGNDLVVGGIGADRMFGGDGQDLLDGGEGNDVIDGGDGVDVVLGGAGDDRASGQGEVRGGAGDDWVSGDGGLYGDAGDDLLQGTGLSGGAGDDRLEAVGDFANYDGGAGVDTLVIDLAEAAMIVITIEAAADVLEFHGIEDAGAPGLPDDLDGLASFSYDGFESDYLWVAIGPVQLLFGGLSPDTDSFADIVDDPATQLVVGEDALI